MTNRDDEYAEFCRNKRVIVPDVGFDPGEITGGILFPFQRHVVRTCLRRGRSAAFLDCGLGKGPTALTFAHMVQQHTGKQALILTPLGVARQFEREGLKFDLPVNYATCQDEATQAVTVSNYERLDNFDQSKFSCIVLDESSCLRNYSGITKRKLVSAFEFTPFKLCCSATPAPNDYIELGNHAEFLGVMKSRDMLTRWFVQAPDKNQKMKLKGHSIDDFWDWVAGWALMAGKPSDLDDSFSDDGYVLPELITHRHCVDIDIIAGRAEGMLMRVPDLSSTGIHKELRITSELRAKVAAEIIAENPNESWLVWADTDYDADALQAIMPGIRNLKGSENANRKEQALIGFTVGEPLHLLTKGKIAGYGMNYQHCANQICLASSYKFEQVYQQMRRSWRFGQTKPVHVHYIYGTNESAVVDVLEQKRRAFAGMQESMFSAMRRRQQAKEASPKYTPIGKLRLPHWIRSEVRSSV
jgi:hypothetical protein